MSCNSQPNVKSDARDTCLIPEGVQVFDGIDNEDRVNRSRRGLEICENVLAKEGNDIHEHVRRGDTELNVSKLLDRSISMYLLSRTSRCDGRKQVDGRVLALPLSGGIGGIFLAVSRS